MNFNWYLLFNLTSFLATGVVSKLYTVYLEGIGEKTILVTRGNEVSIVYEDVLLPVNYEGENPFIREGTATHYAVYVDTEQNVFIGIEAP